ncbi:hypothetical protein [Bacillus cereus group sp. MYBK74-1]
MTKEQLAKELMVKWFLENKGTDAEEVLKSLTSSTYKENTIK